MFTVSFVRANPSIPSKSFDTHDDAMAYAAKMFRVGEDDLVEWDSADGFVEVAPLESSGEGMVAQIVES